MRKFSVRWWSGPNLQEWRLGYYPHPFAFFPFISEVLPLSGNQNPFVPIPIRMHSVEYYGWVSELTVPWTPIYDPFTE